jgi:gliding motility-associated-like protein
MTGYSGYLDFDYYKLYRANSNNSAFSPITTSTHTLYIDNTLTYGVTYYYYVTGVDKLPVINESVASQIAHVFIKPPKPLMPIIPIISTDTSRPLQPSGIKIKIVGNHPVISWDSPRYNEDKSLCNDQYVFKVYRSTDIHFNWVNISTIAYICIKNYEIQDNITQSSLVYYYKVACVDKAGNESRCSMIHDNSLDFNAISISTDTRLVLAIPDTISNNLYKTSNLLNENVIILADEIGTNSNTPDVLKLYDVYPAKASNLERLDAMSFSNPLIQLIWQYDTHQNLLAPTIPTLSSQAYDDEYSIFWFNGVEWVKSGKEALNGGFKLKTSRFGKYMIKRSLKAQSFVINKVYPRIFTPNGDNRNDRVEFQYENPRDGTVSGTIFDLRGAVVAKLKPGPNSNSLIWDGYTDAGSLANAGTYIYQLEVTGAESKVVNGIVILAK